MPYLHTEAITLRRRRTRDADALVTLYTYESGKITVSTRGVLKPTSRRAGVTQPFNHLHTILYAKNENQEIWTLTQVSLIHQFPSIQNDLTRLSYTSCAAEWIDLLSGEFSPGPTVWELLLDLLERWEKKVPADEELFFYQWRLLSCAGIQPAVHPCWKCGRFESKDWRYQPDAGAVFCETCSSGGVPLSGGAVQALRKMANSTAPPPMRLSTTQKKEIGLVLNKHLEFHGGAQAKTQLLRPSR